MPRKRLSNAPIVETGDGYKQCTQCGEVLSVSMFSKCARRPDGLRQQCRLCCVKYRQYEQSREWKKKNKDKVRQHDARHKQKHPGRVKARAMVRNRVARGTITRPSSCESCLTTCTPEAHHDDYSKPLDVRWLCKQCHSVLSRELDHNAA